MTADINKPSPPVGKLQKISQTWQSHEDANSAKFTRNYLDSLEANFKSLLPILQNELDNAAYKNAAEIIEKYKSPHSIPSWGDLIQLDLSIIQLLNGHNLQLKVEELRQRVSITPFAGRVELLMPLDKLSENGNKELLRAEAALLATRLWQIRKVRYERERKLKLLVSTQTIYAFTIFIFVFVLVMIDRGWKNNGLSFLPVLFAFGVAGAFVSMLRRMQQTINDDSDPDISKEFSALENEGERLWISLITGGAFSILLYFLFSSGAGSGLLGQTLIPEFSCSTKGNCLPLSGDAFLTVNLPKATSDFAKCVVWSFLAGFSEQLVPDVLDSLSKKKT